MNTAVTECVIVVLKYSFCMWSLCVFNLKKQQKNKTIWDTETSKRMQSFNK